MASGLVGLEVVVPSRRRFSHWRASRPLYSLEIVVAMLDETIYGRVVRDIGIHYERPH